ncbi:four-helix bundle copper-binding protein [Legionella oakridgensis]|uniref:Four-helix bundle copper-binding protein n=1 Tax=Legionella oakridgensis ATCC 33761 = DSM 21215 TaxID=1268635 RepID=W0BII3_9GAMM|nr:four-helix bundle copper-binding protein [Legionella oakridgensis]AHE68516.1 hypothetical protein Loa_50p0038 [Legionella oakridgensis ATCC 33761 = DSM 21215]STY41406.1 putative cysteine-rich protein yhjQ [Legionella longbeachae]
MSHHEYQSCIEACLKCAIECEHCATACLNESQVKDMVECIQLDRDCALICSLAAKLMARGSKYAQEMCALCAKVCRDCAKECEQHKHHEHCLKCAEACRKCAEECEKMAN